MQYRKKKKEKVWDWTKERILLNRKKEKKGLNSNSQIKSDVSNRKMY